MRIVPWPEALPAGIEVHRLDLNLVSGEEHVHEVLTPVERLRAQRFALRADRARFVQTRSAVRHLLARRLGCDPVHVPLCAGPHDKPCVAGDGTPLFNVSHAGGHALIALADPRRVTHLGVDIEVERRDFDAEAVLDMALTERECLEVRREPDVRCAFYRRWVGKEAVLKAVGVGVAEHLRCVGIHPEVNGELGVACTVAEWRGFKAMALDVPPGYVAALAWQNKEPI